MGIVPPMWWIDCYRDYKHTVRGMNTMDSNVTKRSVLQDWVMELPLMQQSVLLTAVRGPDGIDKYHPVKYLVRWYRRCILISALDGVVLDRPYDERGGSFTGPSYTHGDYPQWGGRLDEQWQQKMDKLVDGYIKSLDSLPHHSSMHFLHATEILGYKHPDIDIREWWHKLYLRLVGDLHLHPETVVGLDRRLGDSKSGWLERADPATQD